MESIENILKSASDEAPTTEKPETPAAPPTEAAPQTQTGDTSGKADAARDERGRFAKAGESQPAQPKPKDAAPPAAKQDGETIPVKAQLEERRKRQEAERRAAELGRQLSELKQPKPRPDVFQDPDAFRTDIESSVEQRALDRHLNMSEAMVRKAYPDADEAIQAFFATGNAQLARHAMSQAHPYEFVYEEGKKLLKLQEIGSDPSAYEQRLREKLRQELEAEFAAKQPAAAATAPALPTSLATARSAGTRSGPTWGGPASAKQILGR